MFLGITLDGAFPDNQQHMLDCPPLYKFSRTLGHNVKLSQDVILFPYNYHQLFMVDRLHTRDGTYTHIGIKQRPYASGRPLSGAGVGIWLKDSYINGADAVRILKELYLGIIQKYYEEFYNSRASIAGHISTAFPVLKSLHLDIEAVEKPLTVGTGLGADSKNESCTMDVSSLPELKGGIGEALNIVQLTKGLADHDRVFIADTPAMSVALKWSRLVTPQELQVLKSSIPESLSMVPLIESGPAVSRSQPTKEQTDAAVAPEKISTTKVCWLETATASAYPSARVNAPPEGTSEANNLYAQICVQLASRPGFARDLRNFLNSLKPES